MRQNDLSLLRHNEARNSLLFCGKNSPRAWSGLWDREHKEIVTISIKNGPLPLHTSLYVWLNPIMNKSASFHSNFIFPLFIHTDKIWVFSGCVDPILVMGLDLFL